jgi:uncharacterized protein (TIGR03437 family)
MIDTIVRGSVFAFIAVSACFAQNAADQYILILQGPPLGATFQSREALRSAAATTERERIVALQQQVRKELAARNMTVTGSVNTTLNALFVTAPESRVPEMKSIPGVVAVQPQRRYRLHLNEATQLMNAPAAWNLVGGMGNAGDGIKIGIIDTGVEATNPAFQDPTLPLPPGYPFCTPGDCQFTNNKVIVARSYVRLLTTGNPASSTPDDYSARDRDGHGTAVASCAAANATTSGSITFSGMAPKAYIGSYKVFGSPGVNGGATIAAILSALEDAFYDGMDIVNLSLGGPAITGPLDTGAACGLPADVPCEADAAAVENATKLGMIVVAAAGNEGDEGLATVDSPAHAPSAIAVGASTNAHVFQTAVSANDPDAPLAIHGIPATRARTQILTGAVSAPLIDVTQLGNDGFACAALPPESLTGAFALIQRGEANDCALIRKAEFAALAGATGLIFYTSTGQPSATPDVLPNFPGPAATIAHDSGVALKDYIGTKPGQSVTIDPAGIVTPNVSRANVVTYFSSAGPSIGNNAIKPDLAATGDQLFMAAQTFDVLGGLYSSTGFAVAAGTSFSSPITAGAAAVVKQAHPDYTVAQIKSTLVNTAAQDITQQMSLSGNPTPVDVRWLGGGKLDAGAAAGAPVTIEPATISFGALTVSSIPQSISLSLTNHGTQTVTLALSFAGAGTNLLTSSSASVPLAAGATAPVSVTLSGPLPAPGSYSGALVVNGASAGLRVPYLYVVGSGTVDHLINLGGFGASCSPQATVNLALRAVDKYGVVVVGQPVTFSADVAGSITPTTSTTDQYGIAHATLQCGAAGTTISVNTAVGGFTFLSSFTTPSLPAIAANGVVNGASFEPGKPVAPGSYIAIFGTALQKPHLPRVATTEPLPLVIQGTRVSFDRNGISEPGHLVFSSPEQINLQVPWELQGQSSAQIKVLSIDGFSQVVTVPLANFAPAFFENSGRVAAQDVNFNTIDTNHPAHAGQTVILYANGLGPVKNQPASGSPALAAPLSATSTPATVTVGQQNATVLFSGLAPGYPALYQINATLPQGLAAGIQPITVTIGGITSKASHLPVE